MCMASMAPGSAAHLHVAVAAFIQNTITITAGAGLQTGTPSILIITSFGICFRQGHDLDRILFPTVAVSCKLDNSKTWGSTSWSARYGFVKQERKFMPHTDQQLQSRKLHHTY